MSKYIILPDVTCDLSPEIREYFGLTDYIHGYVYIDETEVKTTLDWENIKRDDFYKKLDSKKHPYKYWHYRVLKTLEDIDRYMFLQQLLVLSMHLYEILRAFHPAEHKQHNHPVSSAISDYREVSEL